jgi:hypothetical protein
MAFLNFDSVQEATVEYASSCHYLRTDSVLVLVI